MSGVDLIATEEILELAYLSVEPGDRSQRKSFEKLMGRMHLMRNDGYTFEQITGWLNRGGFTLQISTVRAYYREIFVDKLLNGAQGKMNEEIQKLEEIKRAIIGTKITEIAGKVAEIRHNQRAEGDVESRVNNVFGINKVEKSAPLPTQTFVPIPPAHVPPFVAIPAQEPVPVQVKKHEGQIVENSNSSVTSMGNPVEISQPSSVGVDGFFDLDAPCIPQIENTSENVIKSSNTKKTTTAQKLHCLPLQPGIKPLSERPETPKAVYEEGALEHPAVCNLLLTRSERMYGAFLEICDENGEIRTETGLEKRMRIKWLVPVPPTQSSTLDDFVITPVNR